MWSILKKTNEGHKHTANPVPTAQVPAPPPPVSAPVLVITPSPAPVPVSVPQIIQAPKPQVPIINTPVYQSPNLLKPENNLYLSKSMPEKSDLISKKNTKKEEIKVTDQTEVTIEKTKELKETTTPQQVNNERVIVWAKLLLDHKEINEMDKMGLRVFFKDYKEIENLENEVFKQAYLENDSSYITVASDIVGQIQDLFKDFTPQ